MPMGTRGESYSDCEYVHTPKFLRSTPLSRTPDLRFVSMFRLILKICHMQIDDWTGLGLPE